jgi:hypothetical protein
MKFDSLTQTAAGLNFAEAEAYNSTLPDDEGKKQRVPLKALPVQALDHAAGQLLVLGINAALARTYTVGPTQCSISSCTNDPELDS